MLLFYIFEPNYELTKQTEMKMNNYKKALVQFACMLILFLGYQTATAQKRVELDNPDLSFSILKQTDIEKIVSQ